jgi:hypothetical protein
MSRQQIVFGITVLAIVLAFYNVSRAHIGWSSLDGLHVLDGLRAHSIRGADLDHELSSLFVCNLLVGWPVLGWVIWGRYSMSAGQATQEALDPQRSFTETTDEHSSDQGSRQVYAQGSAQTLTPHPLAQRVCGSPAIDGYAHVNITCLKESPTALWWKSWKASGGTIDDLQVVIER